MAPRKYFLNDGEYQAHVSKNYQVVPFFKAHELACPKTALIQMEPIFLARLVCLLYELDHGLTLNSACRTPSYNATLEGAHKHSLHQTLNPKHKNRFTDQALMTCAVDIKTRGWSDTKIKNLVNKAEKLGFSVGIAKTFIHLDSRDVAGLPPHRFYYGSAKTWFENI
jgi:hypothetical protein